MQENGVAALKTICFEIINTFSYKFYRAVFSYTVKQWDNLPTKTAAKMGNYQQKS